MSEYTPDEQTTSIEKVRLIELIKTELKEHGLIDLTDYINKNSSPGFINNHGFVRSVAYKLEEMGEAEVIVRKDWTEFYVKRTGFSKRHPYYLAFILGTIGLLFSAVAGFVSTKFPKSEPTELREQLQQLKQTQQGLSEDVTNLQHDIESVRDSLTKRKQ
jgi:hypothetical protein